MAVPTEDELISAMCPTRAASYLKALHLLGVNLRERLVFVHSRLEIATKFLETMANRVEPLETIPDRVAAEISLVKTRSVNDASVPEKKEVPALSSADSACVCCGGESLWLVLQRWKKLTRDFYNKRKDRVRCVVLPRHTPLGHSVVPPAVRHFQDP
jgi:hypothetical protein